MKKGRTNVTESRFPCHLWEIRDAKSALDMMETALIRQYGTCLELEDSFALHGNYPDYDDEGSRRLLRCKVCGSLLLVQSSMRECPYWDEPDMYYRDYIPAASVEEADLLNILWNGEEPGEYPFRHLKRDDHRYLWTEGEEPVPLFPEELRRRIREKYAGLSPKHRELLEKLICEAGKKEGNGDND